MTAVAQQPFAVVFGHALRGEACHVVGAGVEPRPLPVADWVGPPGAADRAMLSHCVGATIDIGCGPGRLTAELGARGHVVLGIDVVAEAVGQARTRGGAALHRDVFDRVPGEGRWHTALLADGNVGIGGDPAALLARVRQLLDPRGRVVVEVSAPGTASGAVLARLECACARTAPFRWALLAIDDLPAVAAAAGFGVRAADHVGARWWAVLGEPA